MKLSEHIPILGRLFSALILAALSLQAAFAASSETFVSDTVRAKLISAQDGVPQGIETLSAGLEINLSEGWKTYWRSPGEVGVPPRVDWSSSENIIDVEMLWPAPMRFTAFGIENFGYSESVIFPLRVRLKSPGEPALLRGAVKLLVCSHVCVPETFDLELAIPTGSGIDQPSASKIADFLARVPTDGERAGVSAPIAHLDENTSILTIELLSNAAFDAPDVFAELGSGTALGKPDIRLGNRGTRLWAQFPVLRVEEEYYHDPILTVTDGERAFTVSPSLTASAPEPPFAIAQLAPGLDELAWIVIAAFLGGLILNLMPCVLPVLSIKLSSAIKAQGRSLGAVRSGFLVAALGVMTFMWTLAIVLLALKQLGITVGWGLQFQNPSFLAIMFVALALFSVNMFGLFEFRLPSGLQTRLANAGGRSAHGVDFATGFFGAVLATPCSAPFLGTAIAFALSGGSTDIVIVFTTLGLGLAAPYLIGATFPGIVRHLPKPGRWMIWLKVLLGFLLLGTALWLLWVLASVSTTLAAFVTLSFSIGLVLVLAFGTWDWRLRTSLIGVLAFAAVAVPQSLTIFARPNLQAQPTGQINWITFDRSEIARMVSRGEVVFLDVTADWCLTCKANKALILEREPVLSALRGDATFAMQADWTRPNPQIARFLEANNRFGIPFNAVYGPTAPGGIILPEILTAKSVLGALEEAKNGEQLSGRLKVDR